MKQLLKKSVNIFSILFRVILPLGGIKLWSMEVTGPIDKIGGGLPGTILKGGYNLVYSLFGTYTNVVCSILLIATPIIAVAGIFLKKN